ncbi:MAG TPA: protocatechuate 3,4-dioxygenase [Acetobacteraceae bacterium]|nr:protocatechuate 3,4-dioxygenase [Acetobacteraceae bacterium]
MTPRRPLLLALTLLPACTQVADAQGGLTPTPAQAEGPFYPRPLPAETDADLVRVAGAPRQAQGMRVALTGRVLRVDGTPVPGTRIEIWQTDHQGIYLHPRDPRVAQRDPGFQGYGVAVADAAGHYAFRTIRPAHYPGRTAHIHLRATPPGGAPLTTQVYFPDDPGNEQDGLLRRVADPARRAALMARMEPASGGEERALFDIVLR